MILGQSLYQTFVLIGGLFLIPVVDPNICSGSVEHYTLIFNGFILCQLFNLVACRKINPGEYNIFAGLHKNIVFLLILFGEALVQFILVGFVWTFNDDDTSTIDCDNIDVNDIPVVERIIPYTDWIGTIFTTQPLGVYGWLFSIGVGFIGFIWGFLLRFIPVPKEKTYKGMVEDEEEDEEEIEKKTFIT